MKRLTGAIGALLMAMALFAPGAGAVSFSESGSFSEPAMAFPIGIAVDPESGNVYVASQFGSAGFPEAGTVLRYDAAGTPLSPATMGTGFYSGVAVEQGGDHTVYGYSSQFGGSKGTPYIEAFDAAGTAVGAPFPFDVDVSGAQIGSDSAGNIYFPDTTTNTVKKYTASATAGTPVEFACTGTDCNSTALNTPRDVVVDPAGKVYVADEGNNRVVKFNPDGSYDSVFYEGASFSLAVDTAAEMVLVAGNDGAGQHVTALDYSGAVIGEIPTSELEGAAIVRLAVNPSTEKLYVSEYRGGGNKVVIFTILSAPSATTGAASNVTGTSAILHGTTNPKGSLSEDCRFEYTDDADFQANGWVNADTASCDPQPFNETSPVDVSAAISGLSGGTTYDYRLVAETEGGTGEGDPEQFTTLAAPTATTGSASGISQHAATLAGTVNPNGEVTTDCHIEWGPAAGNYSSGQAPCSPNPGSAATATGVSVSASGLAAGTTYHYRLVEATAGGTATGNDMSFVTLADTCSTNSALCPPSGGGGGSTGGSGSSPQGGGTIEPPRNEAAYKVCVKKASKAYKKALKKANRSGKKKAAKKKAAKKKKAKAIRKCAALYR